MTNIAVSFKELYARHCTSGKSPAPQQELFYLFYDTLANTSTVDSDRLYILRILWHWKALLLDRVFGDLPLGLYVVIKESDSSDVLFYAIRFVAYILHASPDRGYNHIQFFYIGVESGDEDQAESRDSPKIFEQLWNRFVTHPMDTPMRTWAAAALPLVKLDADDPDVHKASGVISQALICRVSQWTTSSRTMLRTKDTLAEMGCLIRAFRYILWGFRNIPSKYLSSVLLAFGCIKCVCTHPLLRTLFPEVLMQVDKVQEDVEDDDVLDQLGQDALNHCVQYGAAHTLQDKSLSDWARRCQFYELYKKTTRKPLLMPKSLHHVDRTGLLVTCISRKEEDRPSFKVQMNVVKPWIGYLLQHGKEGRDLVVKLSCSYACLQLFVEWMYQSERAPRLYQYNLEQLLEALEMAHLYQLNSPGGFGDCVAARISTIMSQVDTELSPADMYYVWLRVTRPNLGTPIHQELAEECFEQMAHMVMDSGKVDEWVRALREDTTSSVGDKRKREPEDTDEGFLNMLKAIDAFFIRRYANA